MRLLVSLTLALALFAPAASRAAMGILHGDGHVYAVSSPPGWQLDPMAGRERGVEAVVYPMGKAWQDSEAIFSVDTERARASDQRAAFIKNWLRELSTGMGEPLHVEPASALRTGGDKLAEARYVRGEVFGYALFAFVFEADVVIRISLTARTLEGFRSSRDAFEQLVASYQFLGTSFGAIDSIPHLVRIADANAASGAGKEYDERLARHFVEHHAQVLKQCIVDAQARSLRPFHLLVLVGPDARASRVLTSPSHQVSSCIGADLEQAQLPPPPAPNWWVRLSMGSVRRRAPAAE